jgi:hypothetical protein
MAGTRADAALNGFSADTEHVRKAASSFITQLNTLIATLNALPTKYGDGRADILAYEEPYSDQEQRRVDLLAEYTTDFLALRDDMQDWLTEGEAHTEF